MHHRSTFQCPNEYIDYFCARLTGAEFKFLVIATRKIMGWDKHRATMRDRISLRQFMMLSGITDYHTAMKSLKRLSDMGILKRVDNLGITSEYRLIRHVKLVGQGDFFEDKPVHAAVETTAGRCGNHSTTAVETTATKPKRNPSTKPLTLRSERISNTTEDQRQDQRPKPTTPDAIAAYLRWLEEHGNGKAEPARLTLVALRQFWNWGLKDESVKSWEWMLYAAGRAPAQFERALGDTQSRQLEKGDLKKPGAYFTRLVKSYAEEDGVKL